MSNKVTGVVHLIEETKSYGSKGFRKRVVVLEQDKGSFTNYVPVEFVKDGCDDADDLDLGDEIAVSFRLNGRRWQKDEHSEVKFFLNAEALEFDILNKAEGAAPSGNDAPSEPMYSSPPVEVDDEAPF